VRRSARLFLFSPDTPVNTNSASRADIHVHILRASFCGPRARARSSGEISRGGRPLTCASEENGQQAYAGDDQHPEKRMPGFGSQRHRLGEHRISARCIARFFVVREYWKWLLEDNLRG
jgi:hypothetical protein